jgi:phenylpropionate dioxygenase-like ring-hydroxylating dioxygenase large terminal subunit
MASEQIERSSVETDYVGNMTDTLPQYQSGAHTAMNREEAMSILDRLVSHLRNQTTDMAPEQLKIPISDYLDQDLWEREIKEIFHTIPLPVGTSAELANVGDFKTMRVVGKEIILVRGKDGTMRAMLNVCRHRAMKLLPDGCGSARRFTCGYHSWTYDTDGTLTGVPGEDTFGDVDKQDYSLVQLPCEERAGFIFIGLTPDMDLGIDAWLGEIQPHLEALELDKCTHFTTKTLPGPNWKVTLDGYLEGYHFSSLHANTVALTNHTNRMTHDRFGPHVRNVFALKTLDAMMEKPREEWDPATAMGLVYWVFPGMSIAGGWRERTVISIILPGDSWGESMTWQTTLLRTPPQTPEEFLEAEKTAEWFFAAFRDEDYTAQTHVQNGLATLADKHMIIGRNETAVQHAHESIRRLMAHEPVHGLR